MKDVLTETKISALFYKKVDDPLFSNDKCYLPPELQYHVRSSIHLYSICKSSRRAGNELMKNANSAGRKVYNQENTQLR